MLKRIVSLMLVLTMLAGYMPTITRGQEMGNTEVTEVTEPSAETTAEEPAEEETAVPAELTTESAEECIPEETVEETVSDEAMAVSVIAEGKWNTGWNFIDNPVSWMYDSEGTFTVYGAGVMQNGSPYEVRQYLGTANRIVIQEGITYIGQESFVSAGYYSAGSLTVEIANSVTKIGDNAFMYCRNLREVTIPDSVTAFGIGVFYECSGLTSITLSKNLSNIEPYTFYGCTSLKRIVIPGSVNTVGERAFESCSALSEVIVEEGVRHIEEYAFYCHPYDENSRSSLKRVVLPESLYYIDQGAFLYAGLTEIVIPNGVIEIGASAFNGCIDLQNVVLSENLQKIGETAFAQTKLESIIIPKNVRNIGSAAFSGCTELKDIYFTGNAPEFGDNIFYNGKVTAYYPEGNATWSPDVRQNYGGKVNWVPYKPEVSEEPHNTLAELTDMDYMAFSQVAYETFVEGETVQECFERLPGEGENKWKDTWADGNITYGDLCAHIAQWKVLSCMNSSDVHGFYAVAFTNDNGEVVIAYRGSTTPEKMFTTIDGAQDWIVNDLPTQVFNHIWAINNQYELGFYFYETLLNKGYTASSIVVTGHSLGGGLAEIVSARYGCKGVTMNAICILDPIYEYAPLQMGETFAGVDKWNFVDHANWYDVFAGMYEHHTGLAERIKPVVAHDSNTPIRWYDSPFEKIWDTSGNILAGHSMKSYAEKDASGNVVLTKTLYEFKPTKPITKMQSALTSLDLGTSRSDAFRRGFSVTDSRTSFGGSGEDEIYSSIRADTLIGGRENDILDGGRGDDIYVYYKGDGHDVIYDVSGTDKVYLRNFADHDEIDAVVSEGSDYINVLCNGTPILSIYRKNRDYSWINLDTFLIQLEGQNGYIDITELFSRKVYDSFVVIQCPVSVEILDSEGKVVFTLEDGAEGSFYTEYGNFYVFEEEGGGYGKAIDLMEGYTVRLVGRDTGTMKIDYWDITDNGLSEAPKRFVDVPITADFTGTFEQTDHGELMLAADTDSNGIVDTRIGYDGKTIPVESVSVEQAYIILKPEETVQLSAVVQPAELREFLCWTIEAGGEEILSVDDTGKVAAHKPGTAYVLATVRNGEESAIARCRVDVSKTVIAEEEEPAKMQLDGIRLATTKATTELYKTEYTTLDILLKLPQNYSAQANADRKPVNNGVAIESAKFTDETMAKYFRLAVLDDRTVQIVPTAVALENAKTVKGSYKGTVTVTVDGEPYETELLTLSVKKTMPKLKTGVAAFNSFYAGQAQPIVITGATVTGIKLDPDKAQPEWLTLKDGCLVLNEKAPAKSISGKVNLLVETADWAVPAALTVSVKNTYKIPGVKLAVTSVTVSNQSGPAAVELKLVPTNKADTISGIGISEITAPEGYTVENFNAETGTFTLKTENGFKAGKIDLKVVFGTVTNTLKLTVKTQTVKLKLSASKVSLNKDLGDVATVAVNCLTAGYDVIAPVLTYDSQMLNVQYENGKLTVSAKDAAYGKTYPVTVSAYAGAPAVKLTVAILKQNVAVKSTVKATGFIDVIRDSSAITVTPTYTNVLNVDVDKAAVLKIYSSADKFKESIAEVKAEGGIFTIDKSVISDQSLKYKAQLETVIGGNTIKSNLISLTVKMGTAKLTVKSEDTTMFSKDKNDRALVWFESVDATLNDIAKVEFKNAKQAAMFELIDYGDGTYAIGFREGKVDKSLIGKTVTVALNVFLEGNQTAKANATANVKLTIVK